MVWTDTTSTLFYFPSEEFRSSRRFRTTSCLRQQWPTFLGQGSPLTACSSQAAACKTLFQYHVCRFLFLFSFWPCFAQRTASRVAPCWRIHASDHWKLDGVLLGFYQIRAMESDLCSGGNLQIKNLNRGTMEYIPALRYLNVSPQLLQNQKILPSIFDLS